MKRLTVDFADCCPNALAELWTGLIHGQQDAGDFKCGIEVGLHRAHQLQHIGDTLAGKVVGLHRDDAVIRGCQRVDRQQFVLQPAVDDDVAIGVAQGVYDMLEHCFAAAAAVTIGLILG